MAPPIGQRHHVGIEQPPQTPIFLSTRVSLVALSILSLAILPTGWNILASLVFLAVALTPSSQGPINPIRAGLARPAFFYPAMPAQPLFFQANLDLRPQRAPFFPQHHHPIVANPPRHFTAPPEAPIQRGIRHQVGLEIPPQRAPSPPQHRHPVGNAEPQDAIQKGQRHQVGRPQ